MGGATATRGGLVFIGATLDRYLRAIDIKTGKELWRARLPAGAHANPITYMAGSKQYVVITAGGHRFLGTKQGDYTMAFTLP
jgi:quinoprotein glucose dehydrogenase